MRRILILSLVASMAAVATESAAASVLEPRRTAGAQLVELTGGNGRAAVVRRGALLITMNRGRLRIVDLVLGDGRRPSMSQTCRSRARRVSSRTLEIRGRNIGCVVSTGPSGAPWQAIMEGRGINASGSVKGSLTLDGTNSGPTGRFRIGGGASRPWPRFPQTYSLSR
jgi:hypothetical protein